MSELQIIPDHDSQTSSGSASGSNYGSATTIYIKHQDGSYDRLGWFKWSDSLIQSYASKIKSINSATWYLYLSEVSTGFAGTVYRASSDWNESTITYDNQPGITGDNYGPWTLTSTGWKSLDITTLFTGWFEQTIDRYGVRLWNGSVNGNSITVHSSENETNKPYILLDYVPKAGGGILNWWFFKEAWEKHDRIWKPKLTEGYSYAR